MTEPPVTGTWRAAHLVALTSLAVTQPLLDVLGQNPTFFVAHGAGRAQVLLVVALAMVVVPAVLITVELVVRMVRSAWAWPVHLGLVGALATLVAAGFLDDLVASILDDLPLVSGPATLVCAVAVAVVFTRAYACRPMLQATLSALVVAPLVFALYFAFASPAHELVFTTAAAAADVSVAGDRPPIVLVVFDELPLASVLEADAVTIDADRFPNLARLAGDGTWYPNATSVAAYTHEAVPAILTGQRVHDENLPPTVSGHPDSLFTLLANDYDIAAYEQLTQLCTPSLCEHALGQPTESSVDVLLNDLAIVAGHVSLPASLEGWLPTINDTWADFGEDPVALDQEAGRLTDERADFVAGLGESDRVGRFRTAVDEVHAQVEPQLTFIHTVFPHVPWSYHADGSTYLDPGDPGLEDNTWATDAGADLGLQRHLLQAQFADHLLGELFDRLDAQGLYDDSLIVFTADHGASFLTDTHRRLPDEASLPGLMPVPLVVKAPYATSATIGVEHTDGRIAETIDLVPTIADLLDVELPWAADGVSLLGPVPEDHERGIYARGETVSTDESPIDLTPVVDHIWERFGVDGQLQLYGYGPEGDLVGRHLPARDRGGADPDACWASADPVEGTRAWVGGHLETDLDGPVDLGIVVDETLAGTTTTYADDDHQHAVFALADPALWPEAATPTLWRITDTTWLQVPSC